MIKEKKGSFQISPTLAKEPKIKRTTINPFQLIVKFAFHFEIKVPESGGGVKRCRKAKPLEVQCKVSTVWVICGDKPSAGPGPLCFIGTNVTAVTHQEIVADCC